MTTTAPPRPVSSPPFAGRAALLVQQDAAYHLVRRRLIGWMFRSEWDDPAFRKASLDRWWPRAVEALRSDEEEFLTPAPVTLYRAATGAVVFADITRQGGTPEYITPTGRKLGTPPPAPPGGWLRHRTSYAAWAEGPFPYCVDEMEDASSPYDDRTVQALRSKNTNLRLLIDGALGPAEFAPALRPVPTLDERVGFRIRAVCKRRNLIALESKQSPGLLLAPRETEDDDA